MLTTLLLMGCSSTPVLKSGEIEIPVHKELDLSASCFFDSVDKADKVTVKSGNLDIQKLGTYSITIAYGNEDYKLKVKVVDKERPILKWKKKRLIFKLGSNLDKVNDAIRDNAVITDNYDKKFQSFAGLKRIPESDKEVVFDVQVKDSSGNLSEKNSLLVQFTSDGKEKSGLKQEHASAEVSIDTGKAAKRIQKRKRKRRITKRVKGLQKVRVQIKQIQKQKCSSLNRARHHLLHQVTRAVINRRMRIQSRIHRKQQAVMLRRRSLCIRRRKNFLL